MKSIERKIILILLANVITVKILLNIWLRKKKRKLGFVENITLKEWKQRVLDTTSKAILLPE